MSKVKLIDLIKRQSELEDRINSLNHMEKNKMLAGWVGLEGQFYEDVKKEWQAELDELNSIINKDIDVKTLKDICEMIKVDTVKLFVIPKWNGKTESDIGQENKDE